jgi:hypothetical protein
VRHALGLASAVFLVAAGPGCTATAAAGTAAASSPRPGADRAARSAQRQATTALSLTDMGKGWVTTGGKLTLKGLLTNKSGQALTGVRVQLRFSTSKIISRGLFEQQTSPSAQQLAKSTTISVPAGGQKNWSLEFEANRPGLQTFGAHAITVQAVNAAGTALADLQTYVVVAPKNFAKTGKKTSVGWIWPLIEQPHRAGGSPFLDDTLNTDFAATGRLGRLVAAAKGTRTPITWSVDPALLQDASDMSGTKGYEVVSGKGTAHKPASQTAATWLNDVKTVADPYFGVPYADADSVALVRSGMTAQLKDAYAKGTAAAQALIDQSGDPQHYAWPAGGAIDQKTLNALAGLDSGQFYLLSSQDLQSTVSGQKFTPDAAASIKTSHGTRTGIAYDATLSEVVSGDTSTDGGRILAQQRLLAETAVLDDELPGQARTVVIAPDRRWSPSLKAAQSFLNLTVTAPWLKGAALSDIARSKTPQRSLTAYGNADKKQELSRAYLTGTGRGAKHVIGVRDVSGQARALAGMIQPPTTPENPNPFDQFDYGVLRATSAAWRGNRNGGQAFLKKLESQVGDTAAQVQISANKQAGLAGRTGVVSFSIINNFTDHPVNVQVRVTSSNPSRLQIAPDRRSFTLPIAKGRTPTVKIPMQSAANGFTTVTIELYTPDGKTRIGDPATMQVHTSGFVLTALLITAGGLVILFVGVGVRATRIRKRRKLAESLTEGDDGGSVGD